MLRFHYAVILALFALPALAQDQNLAPDGEDGPSNVFDFVSSAACSTATACSSATCETDVDEGADGGGDGLFLCTETQNATIKFTFPTPSTGPDLGAGAQTLDLIMTCSDADTDNAEDCTGSPTFDVTMFCNGTTTSTTIFLAVAVTAPTQDHTATFTFPGACAADGSDFEIEFRLGRSGGSPAGRRWAGIEAVEWEVTHAAGGGRTRRMF